MADFQVRDLERITPELGRPYWTARVVMGKESIDVHTKSGSWQSELLDGRHDLLAHVAATLQAHSKVVAVEKAERKARMAAAQPVAA